MIISDENEYEKWKSTEEIDFNRELKEWYESNFKDFSKTSPFYHPIMYKFVKNMQIKHWDREFFEYFKCKMDALEKDIKTINFQDILLSNFDLIIESFDNLLNIEERIILMNRFRGNEAIKAKIFNISIYNDLLNTSYSNVLKLFIKFFSFKEGKDLSQKTLTPLIECMSSKKRDYTKFTELASSNVRNAISHGGVKIEDKMIIFSYREKSETLTTEMSFFDFKDSLFQLFDAISASLLAFFYFLIKKNITFANIISTKNITVDTKKFFEKNCLSSLQINCIQIDEVAVQIQKNKIQYNIELITPDLSENTRLEIGIYIAKCFCQLRDIKPIDAIMISFKSPKTVNSFFRIESSIIEKWNSGLIGLSEVKACINASGDILMCPINEESRNEFEDSFRYYSDIENRDFYLAEIEDISIEGVKRFRAVLYLKHATRKSHVKQITNSAVNILKKIENYGFTTNKVKHGNMEADILYISIYRREVRNRKNRTLLPSNDNFVVQVQYDKDKLFPIRNTYIDRYLKIRKEQEIEYSWNPNF